MSLGAELVCCQKLCWAAQCSLSLAFPAGQPCIRSKLHFDLYMLSEAIPEIQWQCLFLDRSECPVNA